MEEDVSLAHMTKSFAVVGVDLSLGNVAKLPKIMAFTDIMKIRIGFDLKKRDYSLNVENVFLRYLT
jgi:hypothetical protein